MLDLDPFVDAPASLPIAKDWAESLLRRIRDWLIRNVMRVAMVLGILLALVLLRNGVAGLAS